MYIPYRHFTVLFIIVLLRHEVGRSNSLSLRGKREWPSLKILGRINSLSKWTKKKRDFADSWNRITIQDAMVSLYR